MDAARLWCGLPPEESGGNNDLAEALANAGAPAHIVERARGGPAGEFAVWPDCIAAVGVFRAMSTQWARSWRPDGRRQWDGLKYEALPAVTGAHGQALDAQLLQDLRLMEAEALNHLNKA